MSKQYKISVVTPFHNTDLTVFEKSFNSVLNQTIGFNNVEYIIVVHNCKEEFKEGVSKLTKGKKNVKMEILENDNHTPSSPRNYGLNFVTGKYIIFLDSDDCLYPYTLQEVYKEMEKEKADISLFRFDNILEGGKKLQVVHQYTNFDQTREKIVLDRGEYDQKLLFDPSFMTVHTKGYRTTFMRENDLKFDDGISYAEDVLFNTKAFSLANRILILPQLIGYQYYQNAGSAMQNYQRKLSDLYELIKLPGKIAETGWQYGSYMDNLVLSLSGAVALFAFTSDIDMEFLKAAGREVSPYLKRCPNLTPSKQMSENTLNFMKKLTNLVFNKPRLTLFIKKLIKVFHIDVENILKGAR